MTRNAEFEALGIATAELLHDMRGLLALVDARISLVLGEMAVGRSAEADLESALAEHRELSTMVADIVDAVSGRQSSGEESVDPVWVVRTEIERAVRGAASIEMRFDASVEDGTVIFGRRSFLQRAVGNLLRNALRHARSCVEITLEAQPRQGRNGIRLAIEDDGPGVDPALHGTLFSARNRGAHGGVGLGLASVAWAAAQLRGEVEHRSDSNLGGARFEIWFPTDRGAPVARAVAAAAGSQVLNGCSVVAIDDDPAILRVFTRLLERQGARVLPLLPAAGFDRGWLDAIERTSPDAILLDLDLGGESGVQVWELLDRKLPDLADRVIFVSGESGGERGTAAAQRTGRPVIGKPLNLDEVSWVLEQVVLGKA